MNKTKFDSFNDRKNINNCYDKIYRYIFNHTAFATALAKFALPKELFDKINWSSIKAEKTYFVSKSLKGRDADAIYEVQLKKKDKIYIYFLFHFLIDIRKYNPC